MVVYDAQARDGAHSSPLVVLLTHDIAAQEASTPSDSGSHYAAFRFLHSDGL